MQLQRMRVILVAVLLLYNNSDNFGNFRKNERNILKLKFKGYVKPLFILDEKFQENIISARIVKVRQLLCLFR